LLSQRFFVVHFNEGIQEIWYRLYLGLLGLQLLLVLPEF
jgi:hypothetical protein